jgi:hypothetical protein
MERNIAIDPKLLEEAVLIGHHKTKREAINSALKEYVMRHKQMNIVNFFGKVDYATDYDYKEAR